MAKYKLWVDKETCIACGACIAVAPELFKFGDDGKSEAIKQEIDEKEYEKAKEAQEVCPTGSIKIEKIEE